MSDTKIKIENGLFKAENVTVNLLAKELDGKNEKVEASNADSKTIQEFQNVLESVFINGEVKFKKYEKPRQYNVLTFDYEGIFDAAIEDFGAYNGKTYETIGEVVDALTD